MDTSLHPVATPTSARAKVILTRPLSSTSRGTSPGNAYEPTLAGLSPIRTRGRPAELAGGAAIAEPTPPARTAPAAAPPNACKVARRVIRRGSGWVTIGSLQGIVANTAR